MLTGHGDSPLRDTYREIQPVPGEHEGTFNGFRGETTGARIDWVLVSSHWLIETASIVTRHEHERYPSDHFPVTARVRRK